MQFLTLTYMSYSTLFVLRKFLFWCHLWQYDHFDNTITSVKKVVGFNSIPNQARQLNKNSHIHYIKRKPLPYNIVWVLNSLILVQSILVIWKLVFIRLYWCRVGKYVIQSVSAHPVSVCACPERRTLCILRSRHCHLTSHTSRQEHSLYSTVAG